MGPSPHLEKPKLLVLELWGLGDLAIATPFLRAASKKFQITLLAKPQANEMAPLFFPLVNVVPFVAPWTAFHHKYRLLQWPWRELLQLRKLGHQDFDIAVSGRWDPRDHVLIRLMGIKQRLGFPRSGSQVFLTKALPQPAREEHRYEYWHTLGRALELTLPARNEIRPVLHANGDLAVVHTGAGQKLRVWPLDRYRNLVAKLRRNGWQVKVLCDPDQEAWWQSAGEAHATAPGNITELVAVLKTARAFIGNDSGPGHLAALVGVPTFTLFGPQLPQWFVPLHPAAEWLEGQPCPYRPCFDSCRFPAPNCILGLDEGMVWSRIGLFLSKHMPKPA